MSGIAPVVDLVQERRAMVERMASENISSGSSSVPQPQATALSNSLVNAPLPAVDPRTAVRPSDVQRIAHAYSAPEPAVATPDGLSQLAQLQQQQLALQQQLLLRDQPPLWRVALPYVAMAVGTVGAFLFLRWMFSAAPGAPAGFSPMTPEQHQVQQFIRQHLQSGNDEAMQALAVLAKQFKQ